MGQVASVPAAKNESAKTRRSLDRKILLLFAALAVLTVLVSVASYLILEGASLQQFASTVLGGLTASFLIAGIPSYLNYRSSSLTPRKSVLRWMIVISVAFTILMLLAIAIASVYSPDLVQLDDLSAGSLILAGIVLVIVLSITFLVLCMILLLVAFGAVGVMSAIERLLAPWIIRQVASLTATPKPSFVSRAIGWLFDIPNVLDTRTLSLRPEQPKTRVTFADLKVPVLWQLFFGFVLGIYISFNPFVSDRSPAALLNIFSLLTTASALFPMIILPWFLFRRLGASIRGQARQFTLYNGIRARVFQSYLAVGTIVILVRLSIHDIAVALDTYVVAFAAFMMTLLVSALICTFVYFNYFENALAEDIVDGLRGTEVEIAAQDRPD